jgi:hypothetical protein
MTMKKLLLPALLCISPLPVRARQAENGFYERSQDSSASLVKTQDGQEVRLGKRRTLQILKAEMFSQNNENNRFRLSVTVPYDPRLGPSSYILIVDGTAYQQVGSGSSRGKTSSLSFEVTGDDNAKQVAKYFRTSPPYRRHPGHELQVSFILEKQEFEGGEDVVVTLRITNVGTQAVTFMQGGRNRAARDNQYIFSARYQGKQVKDIGTSYHFGGISVRRVLEPSEVFEDKVSLNKWFLFPEAGVYEIHGSYYLAFQDPADDRWKTIWEDYASADFIVRIKERSNK